MVTGVIRWSLRRPWLTAAASAGLLLFGAWYVRDTPLEIFPALTPAQTVVQTDAPGLAADQVEQLVTRPIENVLVGAPGVSSVRSDSIQGLSVIRLGLARGADSYRVRQLVAERLPQAAAALPGGVGAPRIAPLVSPTGDVLQIGFTSASLDPMRLRTLVMAVVRPRLLATAGVANVTVYGGQTRRVEIRARPGDLSDSDLGFADVLNAVQHATSVAGAGFLDTPEQRVGIDPRGQALTADDVAAGQIQVVGSAPVRISDVADVADGAAPAFGDALVMGRPGVLVSVSSQDGAGVMETTHAVEQALAGLKPTLAQQGVQMSADLDRPASFVVRMVHDLVVALLIGMALILVILLVVLRDPRAVLVAFVGIPLSLLASLVAIKALGFTLNAMTLGGLFVALGVVIDDAVIDVESMVSHLRDAEARHASRSSAVLAAVMAVRAPVIYATLLIDVALTPLLFLGGEFGAFLAPLAITIIVASLASLAVAVCLTPAIGLLLLQHLKLDQPRPPGWLRRRYLWWVEGRCAAPGWALAALAVCAALAFLMLAAFRHDAVPSFHDGRLLVRVQTPPATSLEVMRRVGASLDQAALSVPGIQQASERIGRDPTDFSAAGPEQGELELGLDPRLDASGQDRAEQRLRAVLAGYPDVAVVVQRRLDLQQGDAEDLAPFSVSLYGDDFDQTDMAAERIATGLRALPGAGDVEVSSSPSAPTMGVDLNFKRLALYGLSAADVLETVQTAFQGKTVAQIYDNGRPVDLAVTGPEGLRRDPEAIGQLLLRSSSGISVPLDRVANVYLTERRASIQHEAGERLVTVTAHPAPAKAAGFARAAADYMAKQATLPPGIYFTVHSTAAAASADRLALLVNALAAGFAMLGLLLLIFRDGRAALLVLASTVFAFVGGAVAVGLTGGVVSLGSLAGFIALFGLSTRNAIILVSRPHLLAGRGAAWTCETMKEAASQRAAPIMLTALLVAVGVAPLALNGGGAAGEILGPMAVVIIGGALSGAVLTLLFQPALIFAYQRPAPAPLAAET